MDKIQMVDLKGQYQKIKAEVDAGIQAVIDSTTFIKGGKVNDFKTNLEQYLKVKHVIPVANGTDALQISLMALGLKPGDEVITPAFTFIATAEVIKLLGLTPVFVDVEPDTFNIDIDSLSAAITDKTKAIIPVHLFGQNASMEKIMEIAARNNLYVVEDACQSIGSVYTFSDGRKVHSGCMGDIGCTSFFPSKNLGCYGDGGAIFTNNDELAAKMNAIANHGMVVRYYHDYVGVNSRLDSIQAAILDVKLKQLDTYIGARQYAASYYDRAFAGMKGVITPLRNPDSTHVFHQYTLRLQGVDREALQKHLEAKGIPSMVYYPVPLHKQKVFAQENFSQISLPVAEKLCLEVLSLPMHTELTEEQLKYITDNVLNFI
jgi:UDP-2-acetamido-2-deoxy-ribo-hexuluronate aminotransferase